MSLGEISWCSVSSCSEKQTSEDERLALFYLNPKVSSGTGVGGLSKRVTLPYSEVFGVGMNMAVKDGAWRRPSLCGT